MCSKSGLISRTLLNFTVENKRDAYFTKYSLRCCFIRHAAKWYRLQLFLWRTNRKKRIVLDEYQV